MSINFYYRRARGFTLIEVMVAIAIISVALGGPFLAATQSYMITMDSKNNLVASYLAQEGIEYVRMLRDNVFLADAQAGVEDLSNTAFSDFLNSTTHTASIKNCTSGGTNGGNGSVACALDPTLPIGVGSALQLCASLTSCPPLYLVNGEYKLDNTGSLSIFTRSLRFYNLDNKEVQVVSTVTWTARAVTRKIELVSYLSPWQ